MDFTAARNTMIDTQVRPEEVTDPAIHAALAHVPRERFVDESSQTLAYSETGIETSFGRWIWRPALFAKMLQASVITPEDDVLDIAPGSGYSSAILGYLAMRVTGLEEDEDVARAANARLQQTGIGNGHVQTGRLSQGLGDLAPFDLIWVNGAVARIPEIWFEQLSIGGRMMVPVLMEAGLPQMRIYLKTGHGISWRTAFEAAPPVLPGFETAAQFRF